MDTITPITTNLALFADSSFSTTRTTLKQVAESHDFQQLLQAENSDVKASQDASTEKSDAVRKFEVMVLTQFISEVFREQPDDAFGEGMQGDFYISVYSEAIAEKVVDSGGLGIVELL